eukprot:gene40326-29033_t
MTLLEWGDRGGPVGSSVALRAEGGGAVAVSGGGAAAAAAIHHGDWALVLTGAASSFVDVAYGGAWVGPQHAEGGEVMLDDARLYHGVASPEAWLADAAPLLWVGVGTHAAVVRREWAACAAAGATCACPSGRVRYGSGN